MQSFETARPGRLLRWGRRAITVVVIAAAVLLLLLQTSAGRKLVRDWLVDLAEAHTDLRVEIAEVDYDFLPLAFRAQNVRIATPDASAQVEIGDVRLWPSWSSLAGQRAIDIGLLRQVDLSNVRIAGAAQDDSFTASIAIGSLSLSPRGGALVGEIHESATLSATIQGHPLTGRLSGAVALNSDAVEIHRLRFDSSAGSTLEVSGRIDNALEGARADLDFNGRATRDALDAWPLVADRIELPVGFAGRVSGPVGQPGVAVHVDVNGSHGTRFDRVSLLAKLVVADRTLQIESLQAESRQGHVEASGRVALPTGSDGNLDVVFRDVDLRTLLSGTDRPAAMLLAGTLAGRATLAWPRLELNALRALVSVRAQSARASGTDGTIRVELTDGRYHLRHDVTALAIRASGELSGRVSSDDFGRSTVSGDVTLRTAGLARSLESIHRIWRLPAATTAFDVDGEAHARLSISGTAGSPSIDATVDASRLAIRSGPLWTARLGLHVGDDLVSVSGLDLSEGGNRLQASASIDRRTRRLTGTVAADLTEVDSYLARFGDLATRVRAVQATATLGGTLDRPEIVAQGTVSDLTWQDAALGTLPFSAQIAGRELHITATAPALATVLNVTTILESPWPYRATLATTRASVPAVAGLAPALASIPADGTISLAAQASGNLNRLRDSVATCEVSSLTVQAGTSSVALEGPATLAWSPTTASLSTLVLATGQTRLVMSGAVSEAGQHLRADVSLDGRADDIAPLVSLFHVDIPKTSGSLHVRAAWDSSRQHPLEGDAVVGPLTVSFSDTTVFDVSSSFRIRDGVVALDTLDASSSAASLGGSGELPLGLVRPFLPEWAWRSPSPVDRPARFEGRFEVSAHEALKPFVSLENDTSVSGTVSGAVTLESSTLRLADSRGRVHLETSSVSIGGVSVTLSSPDDFTLGDGRLDVPDVTIASRATRLLVGGRIHLSTAAPSVDLAVNGTTDLRPASAFLPFAVVGTAATAVRITGPLAQPALEGEITLQDAGLLIREPRLALTDISGVIRAGSGPIAIGPLTGHANGGSLGIEGTFGSRPEERQLRATLSDVDLELLDGLQTLFGADIAWHAAGPARGVRGKVVVAEGTYREPFSLALELMNALKRRSATPTDGRSRFGQTVPVEVSITTAEDVHVDDSTARVDVGVDLLMKGTLDKPALGGELRAREGGEILVGANVYRLLEGQVSFRDPARIVPSIAVLAETRVGEYDVALDISGNTDRVFTRITSTPPLAQRDLVALLATGRADPLGATSASRGATDQALANVSGNALALAGRVMGFDAVRIGNTDLELVSSDIAPTTRLSVSKMLGPRVELVYSQALEENNVAWVIILRPARTFQFRMTARDDDSLSFEFRQELSLFDRRVRPQAVEKPEALRVAAVRVRDRSTQADLPHVRQRLKLTEGDRFTLDRWHDDRGRLERYFRDTRHWNAQVRATRRLVNGRVELDYEVAPGPLSVLVIRGSDLPSGVIDRMREAWTPSVYDEFLRDDLRQIALEHLVERGYVQPAIAVTVEESLEAGEKIVSVDIDRGRSYERTLVFSGNRAISSSELSDFLDAQGLGLRVWLDANAASTALTSLYHSRSFLAARVTVGAVDLTSNVARLPIAVDEGPEFSLGAIAVAGNAARDTAGVLGALSVKPGAKYQADTERTIRQEVERAYLKEGFNEIHVETRTEVHRDTATVALTLQLDEGPRQVVRDVEVTGSRPRDLAGVERALGITPGTPADLEAWEAGRLRVYELGRFRSVELTPEPVGPSLPSPEEPQVAEQPVRAHAELDEWSGVRLRYGLLLELLPQPASEGRAYSPGGAIDVQQRNAFGRNLTLGLGASYTTDGLDARMLMARPRLFGLPGVTSVYLSRSTDTEADDTFHAENVERGVVAEHRTRVGAHIDLAYSYRFETQDVRLAALQEADQPTLDIDGRIGRLNATFAYDSRNSLFDARRGWLHSSSFDYGATLLGSRIDFTRYVGQQLQYVPIGPVTIATGIRIGLLDPSAPDINLLDLRFDAGGGSTVRGYRQDELSADTFFGAPLGGNALLLLNAELRFHTPLSIPLGGSRMRIGGAVFADAGNTFTTIGDLSLGELAAGLGFGVRFDSPIGLLRVDLGFPVPRPSGSPRYRWHFGIGQAF